MNTWQFTPFALLYLLAVVISLVLTYLAWKMRSVRGTTYFRLMTLSAGIWSLGYLLGFFNTDLDWKLIMLRVEYLGLICTPFFWLLFVVSYTQNDQWLTRRNLVLLAIVPAMSFLLILTVQQHDLFYRSYKLTMESGLVVTTKVYGPGFYLSAGYSYFLFLAGAIILIRGVLQMPARFRGQIIPLVLVVVVILFPNFLYITGNNPMSPYDPTSLALVIVGLLFMIIMRRHKFLDVVPVAHNLVFKNVNSGVIILDERMHILEMNPAAEQILNCKQEEMMGKPVVGLFPEHKDLIMRTREVLELTTEIEMGSNMRIYELQTTPLTDHTDRPAGRIIMLYDITERRHALDELDAYAQTVAHDLKNPLSSLLGFVEFLKLKELPDKERERFLQAISNGASKMNDIVDGLLLLASVRSQEEIEISPLDMDAIVSSAVSRLSDVVTEHGAQISQPDTWSVALGYAPWVEEIWVNYISNAIKYGGSPPIVKLGADWQDTAVHFWVQDNGRGLSEEEQSSLFTEFARLERHKDSIQGHGLGLSIVQRITRKLGGEVGVESNVGEGSTFYFNLPAATVD